MLAAGLWCAAIPGCGATRYDLALATRAYPRELHQTRAADIHVFRDGSTIEFTNTTPRTYSNFDLWINQRYMRHVDSLRPGETIELSLWDFRDEWGYTMNAGGLLRTDEPTPVRLVEVQLDEQQPLIGLIAIRVEEAE